MGALVSEVEVKVTTRVTSDAIFEVLSGAVVFWAMLVEVDEQAETCTVVWSDDGEQWASRRAAREAGNETHKRVLTVQQLADALAVVACGQYVGGMWGGYAQTSSMSVLMDYEQADWDADTGQFMLQAALFPDGVMFG